MNSPSQWNIIIDLFEMSKTARVVIIAFFIAAALVFYWGHRRSAAQGLQVGDSAPDFLLPGLEGKPVGLAQFRHRVVVLNFWATWCPPCVEETPSLEKFSTKLAPRGVEVIGVSVDEDPGALKKFVAANHLSFPIARDPGGELAARFGTFKFPETYILDRNGKVAEKIIGAIDWQDPRIIAFVESLAPAGGDSAK
jgi:peroxiredoxin